MQSGWLKEFFKPQATQPQAKEAQATEQPATPRGCRGATS